MLYCAVQDQIKYRLKIGIRDLIEGCDIPKPFEKAVSLDLDQLRPFRKLNKVIAVMPCIMLCEIQSE